MDSFKTISAKDFYMMDRSGCTVVDMRNPADIQIFGPIEGAVNIPTNAFRRIRPWSRGIGRSS